MTRRTLAQRRQAARHHEGKGAQLPPWTADEIIDAFREYALEHGEAPKCGDLGRHGLPWLRSVQRVFGSLPAAQKAAGLPPRHVGRPRRAA